MHPISQPFPNRRATAAQRAEDAFMQEHGGAGPRIILGMVDAFDQIAPRARRLAQDLALCRTPATRDAT